jgi:sulfite reductase (NADPH) flavoprotein alpha-component
MTLSFWRYSHLVLALTSALFLIIASVTGVILACEPISKSFQSYNVTDLEEVTAAAAIKNLKKEYEEVLSIQVTTNDFIIASVITKDGINESIYINPSTGHQLGIVEERSSVYIWATNLHRSLFLKSIGRFFVGFVSLLLCFIAVTGLFLLAQRQGGFLKLYSKIKEHDFNQRYHVVLGRWLLIPLIIIAATGVYLSAEKFDLLPTTALELDWSKDPLQQKSIGSVSEITFFKDLKLSEVRTISFPFSEDELDYFEISLRDRDLLVHQYTGEIISEVSHPFTFLLSQWSFNLHTGTGSILWSVILLISSASILFFIFSGVSMYLKRLKKTKTALNIADKDASEIVILVGSESGNTYAFAKAVAQQISQQGKSVFLGSMNEYTTYKKASHLLIMTATYGDGDAPTNARHFLEKLPQIKQLHPIRFAVLGFGSMDYEHYCRFAIQVDAVMHEQEGFVPLLPLEKINEQSEIHMRDWLANWSAAIGAKSETIEVLKPKHDFEQFEVIERSLLNVDQTYLLKLKPRHKQKFQSGDILHVLAPGLKKARAYSVARIGNDILLSIKKHDKGICSSYMSELCPGHSLNAYIEHNPTFHLPEKSESVIMISNGTGMAPFLGMIHHNKGEDKECHLFWGGKFQESIELYQPFLVHTERTFSSCMISLSRDQQKRYVQDKVWEQRVLVANSLEKGGHIMICGSIAMRNGVLSTLEKITIQELKTPLVEFEFNGQILTDCY